MDREIKFRGKSTENSDWTYGDLVRHLCLPGLLPEIFSYIQEEEGVMRSYQTPVYHDTIGQYIGIKDKNGVEIYEGDIVVEKIKRSRKDGERLVVCFEEFEWKGKNANGATTSLSLLAEYHTIEIVGNIHDNPELIKKEETK